MRCFRPKKPLQLPATLTPEAVIQEKLQILIQSNIADSAPVGKNKKQKRCKFQTLYYLYSLLWLSRTVIPHKSADVKLNEGQC